MKINIFKKEKDKKGPKYGSGSHLHLREQKKKKIKKVDTSKVLNRRFLKKIIIIMVPVAVVLILSFLVLSGSFKVKKVTVTGLDPSFVRILESEYLNKNLVSLSVFSVEESVSERINEVASVYVRKIYPDTLEIAVYKSKILGVYVDLQNLIYFDEDLHPNAHYKPFNRIELAEFERKVLFENIDLNSNEVQELYINNLKEDEIEEFKWEDVTKKQKEDLLGGLKKGIEERVSKYKEEILLQIPEAYKDLPIVFSYINLQEGIEEVDLGSKKVEFSLNIFDVLSENELVITSLEWISKADCKVVTDKGKTIFFSALRDLDDQLIDLNAIIYSGDINKGKFFDLRTKTYTIWQ